MSESVRLPSIQSLLNDEPYTLNSTERPLAQFHPHSHSHSHSHPNPQPQPQLKLKLEMDVGMERETPRSAGLQDTSSNAMAKKNKRRSNLPKETIQILNQWLLDHLHNPYPTQQEKRELLIKTGLTKIQLSNWFINVRRRKIFNDYYTLASNLPDNNTQSPQESNNNNNNNGPPVTIMSDNEFSQRFVQAPLTRRKKLIDRLEELKNLTNDANH